MKHKTMKVALILCLAMALALLLGACSGDQKSGDQETGDRQTLQIEIKAPSSGETTIAPGRHFKVSGSLSGEIPDNAVLKVTLLDEAGQEVRYAATDQKGIDRVIPSVVGGEITVFAEDTDFSEVAYTAPEMAVADEKDPKASAHDATVKCVYTDTDFYALIVSATDREHGLAEADGYELIDQEGKPYDALPEGKYKIQVNLSSADGKDLASAEEGIQIGRTAGTIIHEITTETAIKKGGMDLLTARKRIVCP